MSQVFKKLVNLKLNKKGGSVVAKYNTLDYTVILSEGDLKLENTKTSLLLSMKM